MLTDTERLDWLQKIIMDTHRFDAQRDYNSLVGSLNFRYQNTITIFTIPTQHITTFNIRDGIDYIVQKMKEEK